MGSATIISGGADGRYTIELDYGSATKTALLTKLGELLTQLDLRIIDVDALIVTADAEEAEQLEVVNAAFYEYGLTANNIPPGSPTPDSSIVEFELKKLTQIRARNRPLRLRRDSLTFQRAAVVSRIAYWNAFEPVTVRQAWCVDLTEDAPADRVVATHEIPGEPSITVIAAGARLWAGTDGTITAREIMSPEQAFFNAAILPGWQKFKPTYRWGTITDLDTDADTADVSLDDAESSAQSLLINQASTLTGIPVEYMDCNADAFEVGDRVVVEFTGQDWSAPKVIGFLDNPKPCITWPIIKAEFTLGGESDPTPTPLRNWVFAWGVDECGEYVIPGDISTARGATGVGSWAAPAFRDTVSEDFEIDAGYSLPDDTDFGYFSMQTPNTGVPSGSAPGRRFSWGLAGGATLTITHREWPFADRTGYQYDETCTPEGPFTAPDYTLRVIGDSHIAAEAYAFTDEVQYSGPPGAAVGLPSSIVVNFQGGVQTKTYSVNRWALSGSVLTAYFVADGTAWY